MNFLKILLLSVFFVLAPRISFAERVVFFEGQVDFQRGELDVVLDLGGESTVGVLARRTSKGGAHFSLDVKHLKTPFFDLLSQIESSVKFVKGKQGIKDAFSDTVVHGKVWSEYSLVDYKPINELAARFEVKDKRLYVTALSFGNITCDGYLDLVAPYKVDVSIHLFDVAMNDFLNFWTSNKRYESSGAVFGTIKASGAVNRLTLKGRFESRNGFVETLNYDAIVLNVEGVYPNMKIVRSTISKSDGVSFSLAGPFDLSDTKNFTKQVKGLTIAPLVKDSGSELEWTIKRRSPQDSGTTELKYRFKKENALIPGISADSDIDMLGIERKRRF